MLPCFVLFACPFPRTGFGPGASHRAGPCPHLAERPGCPSWFSLLLCLGTKGKSRPALRACATGHSSDSPAQYRTFWQACERNRAQKCPAAMA